MKKLIRNSTYFLLLSLLLASPAFGIIRYIDSAAPGGGNGQSWATAWNSFGQVTGIGAGDTLYVSGGTTTKTYSITNDIVLPNGNSSAPFTMAIGQEAGHNGVATFVSGGGDNTRYFRQGRSYVTIDGRLGGGNNQHFRFNGGKTFVLRDDGNGTLGGSYNTVKVYGCQMSNGVIFWMYESVSCEIAYCVFDLALQPASATEALITGFNSGNDGVTFFGDASIHDNVMNLYYIRGTDSNGNNGNDFMKNMGGGIDVYNNRFIATLYTGGQNGVGGDHQDGMQWYTNYARIWGNYFENCANYMIYIERFGGGANNIQIFNNVFNFSDSVLSGSQPTQAIAIGAHGVGTWTNMYIFNNTFRGGGQAVAFGDSTASNTFPGSFLRNNLTTPHTSGSGPPLNVWNGSLPAGNNSNNLTGVAAAYFVNRTTGDFHLTSSATGAINAGNSASLTGITTVDFDGNSRTGTWDIGAFEFGSASGDPLPGVSSTSIPAAGTTITITFSENVTVSNASGFTITMSGGAAILSGATVLTPTTLRFNISRTIGSTETGTISYTTVTNGIEDSAGQDLQTFSGLPIGNGSTVPTTASPVFSPVSGPYFGTQNITITSSTPGATIRYTTDGSDPTGSSTQYTGPVPVSISTTIKAKAFASGFIDSPITQASYEIGTWVTSGTAWKSFPVTSQTGTFTWNFRASASTAATDGVIGLSSVLPDGFNDLGPIIQFNTDNTIKARNGANYEAINAFTYIPGTTYEIACTINISTRKYSVTAAQIGGSPIVIANNYDFRSDSPVAPELDNFGMSCLVNSLTVSQMSFGTVTGVTPTLTSATIQSTGTTLTLGFSVPVTYGTGGNGGWTMAASGGAVTLTPTASPTSFTLSRAIAVGETGTVSYTQPGNGVEAVTGGGDLVTLTGFAFNNQSVADLIAPTPNPMSFSSAPTATSSFSVTMTASVATDASTPPVQYYFDETSGNPGGTDSGWQSSRTYINNNLSPGIQYTYRVLARDNAATPNQTTPSSSANVTTPIIAGGKIITPAKGNGAAFVNP